MTGPIASTPTSFGNFNFAPAGGAAMPSQPQAPQMVPQGNQQYATAYTPQPVDAGSGDYLTAYTQQQPGSVLAGGSSSTPALNFFAGDASIALAQSASSLLRENEKAIKAQMTSNKPMDESTVQLLRLQTQRIETINSLAKMLADCRQKCMQPWTQ